MAYQTVPFDGFGAGLNLRDKADAVNSAEAIDCLNVEFTERGVVKQRPGWAKLTPTALTNPPKTLHPFYTTTGTRQLLAGCGSRLEALSTAGAVVASATALTDSEWDFCRFGSPGSEVAYAGNGKNLLRKWNGATWASVANSPKARYLAVMAVDQGNRMVVAGFDDGANGPSAAQAQTDYVWFSAPGLPETFNAQSFISLTPGDGEKIQHLLVWREFVFVFKESKFFVVYGTTADSAGNPVFNYRTVDTGVGLAAPRAICASPNGVYFMDRDGIYVTTGGDPEKVSDLIDPIWEGSTSIYYTGGVLDHSVIDNCAMSWHADRLHLAFPTTAAANDRLLIHDPRFGWWSLWSIPAAALSIFRAGSEEELVFATGSLVGRHSLAYANDDGAAIESHWRSGWFDHGLSVVKTLRETKVWGAGACQMAVSADFSEAAGSLTQMDFSEGSVTTWGGSTWGGGLWESPAALRPRFHSHSIEGTVFSTHFQNNVLDQTWAAHRLVHHQRDTRVPSVA